MARLYTDTTSVELFLSDATAVGSFNIHDSFSIQFSLWIEQMSKFIEQETDRQFIAETVSSVKLYEVEKEDSGDIGRYNSTPTELKIDEAVSISKVEVKDAIDDDFVEVAYNKILFYPANSTPKMRVFVDEGATTQFSVGHQNIKVTGLWGYATDVPADIKFAATVLVAGVLQYSHRHQGQQTSLTMGRYQVAYRSDRQLGSFEQAKSILERYKRKSII